MKILRPYGKYFLYTANILIWVIPLLAMTAERTYSAERYLRHQKIQELGQWEAYVAGEAPELKSLHISQADLVKYSWPRSFLYYLHILLPFAVLIYSNWLVYIPRLLAQRRYLYYGLAVFGTLIMTAIILGFHEDFNTGPEPILSPDGSFNVENILFAGITGGLSLLITTPLYLSYHWFTQQEKLNRLQNEQLHTELAFLKSQVNPHFFFNTLNNLYALALERSNRTPTVILRLSDLMRYTIYNGQSETVPLTEEIKCLEDYLELQKIRLQKQKSNIQFTHHIDDERDQVPPLLFLSFVENAFKHGVDTLTEEAYIYIQLEASNGQIYFTMHNNYDPAERHPGSGIGIGNARRRLELSYPPGGYHFQISDENDIFHVHLQLPTL